MSVIVALLAAGAAAAEEPLASFSAEVFSRLGAEREECRGGTKGDFGEGAEVHCALPNIKAKQFLGAWREAFPEDQTPGGARWLSSWVETYPGWVRRYLEPGGVPAVVAYGGRQRGLILAFFVRYPKCKQGGEVLPRAGQAGVSRPEHAPGAWVQAVYPPRALRARMNGMVLMRAIVGRGGETRSVCVLDVQPRGYGFEEAAMEEVGSLRYEPARRDGEPVEVQLPVARTFEVQ